MTSSSSSTAAAGSEGLAAYVTALAPPFLDQIAASGEQPFEAIRTRPFHYRCFNLEAMITNAKLGDQVGLNLWTMKSRYGATIQTALDYTMTVNPKQEDGTEVYAHVAAVAAAYGDPAGKYSTFLNQKSSTYKNSPWWYYDQPGALRYSPAAADKGSSSSRKRVVFSRDATPANNSSFVDSGASIVNGSGSDGSPDVPFVCPSVFDTADEVQLDDGIFISCNDIKPFYFQLANTTVGV